MFGTRVTRGMSFKRGISMNLSKRKWPWMALTAATALVSLTVAYAQQLPDRGATSYMPVDIKEPFAAIMARMKAAQPAIQKRQADLLAERYDLANRAAAGVTMTRGKPVQEGGRAKLPAGAARGQVAGRRPHGKRGRRPFSAGFFRQPH